MLTSLIWHRQGYKRPLQLEDVFDLAPDDRVETVAKDFDRRWDKELRKKETGGKPSLVRTALQDVHLETSQQLVYRPTHPDVSDKYDVGANVDDLMTAA